MDSSPQSLNTSKGSLKYLYDSMRNLLTVLCVYLFFPYIQKNKEKPSLMVHILINKMVLKLGKVPIYQIIVSAFNIFLTHEWADVINEQFCTCHLMFQHGNKKAVLLLF